MILSPALTLDLVIEYLIENKIDDPRLYDYLTVTIAPASFDRWTKRIIKIDSIKRPSGTTADEWEGRTNEVKGRCFEKIGGLILSSVKPFHTYSRVLSSTNEIDWLVELGPSARWLQTTSEWGTHFVCECKFGKQKVNAGWIGKLNAVLTTHSASVGLLISSSGLGEKGGSQKLRFQLQMLAAVTPPRVIICMNAAEVRESVENGNFLRLLCQRYVQTKVGASTLLSLS